MTVLHAQREKDVCSYGKIRARIDCAEVGGSEGVVTLTDGRDPVSNNVHVEGERNGQVLDSHKHRIGVLGFGTSGDLQSKVGSSTRTDHVLTQRSWQKWQNFHRLV